MKIILRLLFLFSCHSVFANEIPIELNSENLTLLALKHSSPDVISEYILSEVKSKHTKQYFKTRNKPDELKKLIEKVKQDVNLSISKTSMIQTYKQELETNFIINNQRLNINIDSLYPIIHFTILRKHSESMKLSKYFNLIIANLEIINSIEISQIKKDELLKKNLAKVYLNVTYKVSKYQNQQNFQVVIQNINLYEDMTKTNLIATVIEKRSYTDIVDNWILSEGFSTNLVGIHAFSYLGYRLQDEIKKSYIIGKICEKSQMINNHRVLICRHGFTTNSEIIAIYIGGVLAQVDLIANQKLESNEIKFIFKKLSTGFKNKIFNELSVQSFWSKYNVDFNFFSGWYDSVSNKANDFKENNYYRLIFSMSSHETNELFEKNK